MTKPGLGLEIGKAAINATPIKMIEQAVREVAAKHLRKHGVNILISVPKRGRTCKKD